MSNGQRTAAPRGWVRTALLAICLTLGSMSPALTEDGRRAALPTHPRLSAEVMDRRADLLAEKLARREPVEVLILMDDAVQVQQLAQSVGTPGTRSRLDRPAYVQFLRAQKTMLRALKDDVLLAAAEPDVDVLTDYEHLPVVHARIRSARALENLRRQGRIRSIDPVVHVRPSLAESLALINQPTVAAAGHLGAGTSVAVLDTGVDYTRAAFGACGSPGGACKVAHVQDFATQDNVRDQGNFHGTNVSGIVLGVAPATKILGLDVFEANGTAGSNVILAAINWCIANKATYNIAAINMSLGGGRHFAALAPSDTFGTAVTNAMNAGIVVIAASGNDGYTDSIAWPAAYSNIVSVGAFYDAGASERKITSFSNSAGFLTMAAPGSMIVAAGITMQGTSQAAPHVAGAAAVLRSVYSEDSAAQLVNRLKLGDPVLDTRNGVSRPGLDLAAATATPPATYRLTVNKLGSGSGTVSSDPAGIQCGSSCTANLTNGGSVTLTALHGAGAQFAGWSGACAGSGIRCTLAMTTARAVTASFVGSTGEDFAAGGNLPRGWATAAGANAGWQGSTDSRFVGSHALKSAGIGHGQSAGVSVTGSFRAGEVSFARRVSSESGADLLKFFIDGQLQGSWSGEQAWGMVSYPLTAGSHTLTWSYEKNGSGSAGSDAAWLDSVNLPWAAATAKEAARDFNGDGRADILWRHDGSGAVAIWAMDASNRLSGSGSLPAPGDLNWRVSGTGDFNGDGLADIFWRHTLSGNTAIWFMSGLERLATATPPGIADQNWQVVAIADYNGDGKSDVLFRHGGDGRNVIWLMDGGTRVSATFQPQTVDARWQVVASEDFDGDGKADIVWRHAATGRNALWLMDGATRRSSTELPAVSDLGWRIVGAGDFDGDGKADLFWRHTGRGSTSLWRMNGATRLAALTAPSVGDLGWRVAGVGDFDGDGKADLLWRHAGHGGNSVWTMNGATRTAAGALQALGDSRWRVVTPRANAN